MADPWSPLNIIRAVTALRHDQEVFHYGDTHFNSADVAPEVVAFVREFDGVDQ